MTNNEIFEAIDQLQYVLDKHAKSGVYQFANQDDIKLLEKVYNHITKRQYIKFNAGCSSCIRESFLIIQNWKRRELKKMEAEEATEVELTVESVEEVLTEPEVSAEDALLATLRIEKTGKETEYKEIKASELPAETVEVIKASISYKDIETPKAEEPKVTKPKSNGRGKRK